MNTFLDKWTFRNLSYLQFFKKYIHTFLMESNSHNLTFSWQFRVMTLNTNFYIVYKFVSALDIQFPNSVLHHHFFLCPSMSSRVVSLSSKFSTWASPSTFWPSVCTELCCQTTKVLIKWESTWIKHNSIGVQKTYEKEPKN